LLDSPQTSPDPNSRTKC